MPGAREQTARGDACARYCGVRIISQLMTRNRECHPAKGSRPTAFEESPGAKRMGSGIASFDDITHPVSGRRSLLRILCFPLF